MAISDRKQHELRVVELLSAAAGLGLAQIRVGEGPPEVRAKRDGRDVGIEVAAPIEPAELRTNYLLRDVMPHDVPVLAAGAGPGEAAVGFFGAVDLALREGEGLREFWRALAWAIVQVARLAPEPGYEVVTLSVGVKETGSLGAISLPPGITRNDEIPLPSGVDMIWFRRTESGPLVVCNVGWIGNASFGPALDTVAERVERKKERLSAWASRYAESWLVISYPGFFSGAQITAPRFPGTGFNRVYLTDDRGARLQHTRLDL